jgi:hypothetical protein
MKYKRLKEMLGGLNMQKYLLIPPTTAVFRFERMRYFVISFHKDHPVGGDGRTRLETVEIDAAGESLAVKIHLMHSPLLRFPDKHGDSLAECVVYRQGNVGPGGKRIADDRTWIERVRIILKQDR